MAQVLIVDDEPLLCEELQETLEFEGYDVKSSCSVNAALELCENASFDVVVTDLKMPERGGLDLLSELKSRDYPATVYVVSGHGADSNRDQAKDLGAEECFAKPLDTDVLIEAIQQTLARKTVKI